MTGDFVLNMADVPSGPAAARVQDFFTALVERDPSARSWLAGLLRAAPYGTEALGELADVPGHLSISLAVRGVSGRLACFEYIAGPPRDLLRWYVSHPDRLVWADDEPLSAESALLRRALLHDQPPGARERAQERALDAMRSSSTLTREWWRFESVTLLDCVLITDRIVVTILGKQDEPLLPATRWYPARTDLVRTLEAARALAAEEKRWATLLLSDRPVPGATREALERELPEAAPHLDHETRRTVAAAYLGNLTWEQAAAAVRPA